MKCIVCSIVFSFALLQVSGEGHERLLQDRPRVRIPTNAPAPNDPASAEEPMTTAEESVALDPVCELLLNSSAQIRRYFRATVTRCGKSLLP